MVRVGYCCAWAGDATAAAPRATTARRRATLSIRSPPRDAQRLSLQPDGVGIVLRHRQHLDLDDRIGVDRDGLRRSLIAHLPKMEVVAALGDLHVGAPGLVGRAPI